MRDGLPLPGAFRAVSQLHENPALVARAQTLAGRVGILLAAAALLYPFHQYEWANALCVLPAVAAVMLFPARRRLLLSLAAVVVAAGFVNDCVEEVPLGRATVAAVLVIILALIYLAYLAARHFQRLPAPVRRCPQVWLHLIFWTMLVLAWVTSAGEGWLPDVLLLLFFTFPFLIWRCGYMLMAGKRGKASSTRFQDHLFYLWPIYGGTMLPFGKGFDYLSQTEARSAESLARSQLAGIKLLVLARLYKLARQVMNAAVYGQEGSRLSHWFQGSDLGVSPLRDLIAGATAASRPMAWLSLYMELIHFTLELAIYGHVVIGCLRLCGFNVFRNMYKPLLSATIVDFWNRFQYYFKELLVEFFFYPAYLRYFKSRPNLRMFTAVFAAAFVGNMYFHLIYDGGLLAARDYASLWQQLGSRLVYCFVLALGIYFSMQRQKQKRGQAAALPAGTARSRLLRLRGIAGVWTFYALIHVWNLSPGESKLTLLQRADFFLSLFGLDGVINPR